MDLGDLGGRKECVQVYEVMYEEEMKKQEQKNFPPQWTHARFLKELVSDLMFPEETPKHLAMLKDINDSTMTLSVRSTRRFLLYGCIKLKVPYDLTCGTGRNKYLTIIKPHRISKFRLGSDFFTYRFDGQRHCSISIHTNDMCQFSLHSWMHVFDDLQRKDKQKKRNRFRMLRCLVCNVNFCHECEHSFHGVELASYCM